MIDRAKVESEARRKHRRYQEKYLIECVNMMFLATRHVELHPDTFGVTLDDWFYEENLVVSPSEMIRYWEDRYIEGFLDHCADEIVRKDWSFSGGLVGVKRVREDGTIVLTLEESEQIDYPF